MKPTEIRCRQPHPVIKRLSCNAKLCIASGDVEVIVNPEPEPGQVVHRCRRCGTPYIVRQIAKPQTAA